MVYNKKEPNQFIVKYCYLFPPFYWLFCTDKHEYRAFKIICNFLYGILLGLIFYEFILVDLDFTENAAIIVGGIICLMLGMGLAISSQIRCITLLTFPNFGSKVGRGVLKALVVAFIISGPIENLCGNGKEVVRVFACTASLTFNLTKTRFELMFKPFSDALFGLKTDANEVKDTLRSIKDVSAPITGELEDESEMRKLREENDYLDTKMDESKRSDNIDSKYKTKGKIKQLQDVRDARDTAVAVMHEVNKKKAIFHSLLVILKRLLSFIFLRIICASQSYHDNYLRNIEFDNYYVTKYFRKIDLRRRKLVKHTLLPLKKIEAQKLIDPKSWRPLKKEKEEVFKETIVLLLEMITATTFILLDRLFFEVLDIVGRHAKIDYHQVGRHDMSLEIKGTGMIASLLRSVVKGFNIKKRINIKRSNEICLPKPKKLKNYYLYKIYGTYFAIWLMILVQAYMQRLRRVICAYFYRKREKKRVLFLYNETLKRRLGFFRFMKKKIKKLARKHRLEEGLNVVAILRVKYPRQCNWLKICSCTRRKCLICGEREPVSTSDFHECLNDNCHFIYCNECWLDLGMECLACQAEQDDTSSGYDTSSSDENASDN